MGSGAIAQRQQSAARTFTASACGRPEPTCTSLRHCSRRVVWRMSRVQLFVTALMCAGITGMSLANSVGPAPVGRSTPLHGFRNQLNVSLQQATRLLQSAPVRQAGAAGVTVSACRAQSPGQTAPQALALHRITGDGRCLFRALAQGDHQLTTGGIELSVAQETRRADELRGQICDEMLTRRDDLAPFIDSPFDAYVADMRQPHMWGDEPEVSVAPHVLRRPVNVFSGRQQVGTYEPEGNAASKEPVNLLYDGIGHYDLLSQQRPTSKL